MGLTGRVYNDNLRKTCVHSKHSKQKKPSPDEMSLTAAEIKCIRDSWAPIYKDPEGNGGLILKTFLDKHDYYHKFARFKDAPRDTIRENPIFRNHAAKIMHTINDAIANVEKEAVLKEKLKNLGKGHAKRGIKPLQFEELKTVILDILKNKVKVSDEVHAAWTKLFAALLPLVFEGLKK